MINTVLGKISKDKLGHTRMHEHITWAWTKDVKSKFDKERVVSILLPYLKELKLYGCNSLVEATTEGAGRDVNILKELSEKSEINIITNCGVWDGLDYNGKYAPSLLMRINPAEIAELWINEYEKGIDGTSVKPGVIKIGLGDNDIISDFQHKFLKAAVITSKHTGLPIISHICSSKSAIEIVEILKSENFELNKFIWSHADYSFDYGTIEDLAKQGIRIELSWHTGKAKDYMWYINTINKLNNLGLLHKLLVSQDAGGFHNGNIVSYKHFYTKFIKACKENNITQDILDKLLVLNPSNVLDN